MSMTVTAAHALVIPLADTGNPELVAMLWPSCPNSSHDRVATDG